MTAKTLLFRLFPLVGASVLAAAACGDPPCEDTLTCDVGPNGGSSPTSSSSSGGGTGAFALGDACSVGEECQSGFCADAVCCDAACDGACVACDTAGRCEPHAEGADPDGDCSGSVCDGGGACQNGRHVWSKSFGSEFSNEFSALGSDGAGNVAMTGYTASPVDFGGGPIAAGGFVALLDGTGEHVWSKSFSNTDGSSVAISSGGTVLMAGSGGPVDLGGGEIGQVSSDLFLVEFSGTDGQHLGSVSFADTDMTLSNRAFHDMAPASNGDVYVVGSYRKNIDFGGVILPLSDPASSGFLVKFDASLQAQWALPVLSSGPLYAVDVDSQGNAYFCGHYADSITVQAQSLTSAGGQDVLLGKVDRNGNLLWVRSYGGAGDDRCYDVGVLADGGAVLTGVFEQSVSFGGEPLIAAGEADAFLVAINTGGSHRWSNAIRSADDAIGMSVQPLAGGVVTTGLFTGAATAGDFSVSATGDEDYYVARYGDSGESLWLKRFGGPGGESFGSLSRTLAPAPDNGFFIGGNFEVSVGLGGGTLSGVGGRDIFVGRFGP